MRFIESSSALKNSRTRQRYQSEKARRIHKKKVRRANREREFRELYATLCRNIAQRRLTKGSKAVAPDYFSFRRSFRRTARKPAFSETIRYLASRSDAFADLKGIDAYDGTFTVPRIFSLTDSPKAYTESFDFLKRLFIVLHRGKSPELIIDYQHCERIDVDASVCMDIILAEFIKYNRLCRSAGVDQPYRKIAPINFQRPEIQKVLFSIGAFSTLNGISFTFPDVIPHYLQVGDKRNKNLLHDREVHITETVDYIVECLSRMERELTDEAHTDLYDVLGEITINAEEHSNTKCRYSIGYFQYRNDDEETYGIVHLVIFNFGNTIYEKFKSPDCQNQVVVRQMQQLSEEYTRNGWFTTAQFEEETLWTLYALQEGVTSYRDWKRGNGSIRFIESFFNLKGDKALDDRSKLTIFSGHARIVFDGSYAIHTREGLNSKGKLVKHKLMPFNKSGDIRELPDKKFVSFAPNYFPGTMISAKICIKPANTQTPSA